MGVRDGVLVSHNSMLYVRRSDLVRLMGAHGRGSEMAAYFTAVPDAEP